MPLRERLDAFLRHRVTRRVGVALALAFAASLLAALVGIVEYRTNVVARNLGAYLVGTNPRRPAVGDLWTDIASRRQARDALEDTSRSLPSIRPTDLPPAVQTGHFELDRIPESGVPNYLSVSIRPGSRADRVDPVRLATARRIYGLSRAILSRAEVHEGALQDEIERRAEAAVADLGTDTAAAMTDSIYMDTTSVEDEVVLVVRSTVRDRVLEEAGARLLDDLREGRIRQVFLHLGLGVYEGEAWFVAGSGRPPLRFRVPTDDVISALGLDPAVPPQVTP